MIVETKPGQGTSLPISVRVVDAISKPGLESFSYDPPLISSLVSSEYGTQNTTVPNFPTTGKYKNGKMHGYGFKE